MEKVYLVTAQDSTIDYGDSLMIGGVFSTKENANKYAEWASDHNIIDNDWEITQMTVDYPNYNKENEYYPSAWYME